MDPFVAMVKSNPQALASALAYFRDKRTARLELLAGAEDDATMRKLQGAVQELDTVIKELER